MVFSLDHWLSFSVGHCIICPSINALVFDYPFIIFKLFCLTDMATRPKRTQISPQKMLEHILEQYINLDVTKQHCRTNQLCLPVWKFHIKCWNTLNAFNILPYHKNILTKCKMSTYYNIPSYKATPPKAILLIEPDFRCTHKVKYYKLSAKLQS